MSTNIISIDSRKFEQAEDFEINHLNLRINYASFLNFL